MADIDLKMAARVAYKIKGLPLSGKVLEITERGKFPADKAPGTVDFFFVATMQEFGTWKGNGRGFERPIFGELDGQMMECSDLFWTLSMKMYEKYGPEFFKPDNLARLSFHDFCQWLPEKYGFQDLIVRHNLVTDYGKYCIREMADAHTLVQLANYSEKTLPAFMSLTSKLPGYDNDPLFKKNILLAMILANRPENFLKAKPEDFKDPIIDIHLMRIALRLGLVTLTAGERLVIEGRTWASKQLENEIRERTFQAIKKVIKLSGKPMSEVDFLLWGSRNYCPEMEQPNCRQCVFNDICRKKTELFQPVFRTTNY